MWNYSKPKYGHDHFTSKEIGGGVIRDDDSGSYGSYGTYYDNGSSINPTVCQKRHRRDYINYADIVGIWGSSGGVSIDGNNTNIDDIQFILAT